MTSSSERSNWPLGTWSVMLALRWTRGPSGTVAAGMFPFAAGLAAEEAGAWAAAWPRTGTVAELAVEAEVATPPAPPHAASGRTASEPSRTSSFWRNMAYGTRLAARGNSSGPHPCEGFPPRCRTRHTHPHARPRRGGAAPGVRPGGVPARPGARRRGAAPGPRRPGGRPDRLRQEHQLLGAGGHVGRPHAGRLAAHRADEGPGRPPPS